MRAMAHQLHVQTNIAKDKIVTSRRVGRDETRRDESNRTDRLHSGRIEENSHAVIVTVAATSREKKENG
ncbi:hypothetical protein N7533_000162 [Penicillium manginii]|uniref:uncharacterized protein n=1 Tax=Penicillium manginii TaxID=203109 RepID=UPI002546FCE5|nr:uncharacterized protein N7533_000162 [Penicillium manginii]KAJ5767579.1 hypothetical protein N7533_000162 [Penicillium manginii]